MAELVVVSSYIIVMWLILFLLPVPFSLPSFFPLRSTVLQALLPERAGEPQAVEQRWRLRGSGLLKGRDRSHILGMCKCNLLS